MIFRGRVTSSLVDESGEDNSLASKGDLLDVAVGGVALLLRIARKDIARSMLGKKIRVELSLENTLTKQIFLSGDIVAIRLRHVVENKYSVHVKFDERLSLDTLQSIVSANSEKMSVYFDLPSGGWTIVQPEPTLVRS
jgi:hypothetical protein